MFILFPLKVVEGHSLEKWFSTLVAELHGKIKVYIFN